MSPRFPFTKDDITALIAEETKHTRATGVWAAYSRKSQIDPRSPGYSMETQPERAEEYARAHGAAEIKRFEDPGRSGRNSKREGLQEMIYQIKAGRIDVVVVHRLDRIFRNLETLLRFVRFLKKYKVRFVSVTEQLDTETWWGRLVLAVLGSLAEAYLWQASDRTREGLAARRARGYHLGPLPFGYCNGLCSTCTDENGKDYCPLHGGPDRPESQRGKVGIPHPIDRHAIVTIFDWYLQGMSTREIAIALNNNALVLPDGSKVRYRPRRGISRRPSTGVPRFNRNSVDTILKNPFYTGQVARYSRPEFNLEDDLENPERIQAAKPSGNQGEVLELFKGVHEALISGETWQAALSMREGKSSSPVTLNRPVRVYPLSGVARCWECFETCGWEFTLRGTTSGNSTRYYRCAYLHDQALKRKPKRMPRSEGINPVTDLLDRDLAGKHKMLPFKKLEEQVDALLSRLVIPPEWDDWIAAYYLSDDGMAEFERAGYQYRLELQQLRDLYAAGHLSGPEFERKTRVLQTSLIKLKPSAKPEAQEIIQDLRDFPKIWRDMTDVEKRGLLDTIFAGLYFDHEGRLIRAMAYEPFNRLLGLPEDGMLSAH